MNPDRFKVTTRMATIGIRGCELGFKITKESENVYVINLAGKETVRITTQAENLMDNMADNKWGDEQTQEKPVNFLNAQEKQIKEDGACGHYTDRFEFVVGTAAREWGRGGLGG